MVMQRMLNKDPRVIKVNDWFGVISSSRLSWVAALGDVNIFIKASSGLQGSNWSLAVDCRQGTADVVAEQLFTVSIRKPPNNYIDSKQYI